VEQGENGTSMFILGVGKCACKMDDVEISVLNPGAFFGEFSPDVEDKIHDDKFKEAKGSEPLENVRVALGVDYAACGQIGFLRCVVKSRDSDQRLGFVWSLWLRSYGAGSIFQLEGLGFGI
jgi:hypothetical protein